MSSFKAAGILIISFGLSLRGWADASTAAPTADAQLPPLTKMTGSLEAFSSLGSSVAHNSHFIDLGWSDAELTAFVDGLKGAFHGKSFPETEETKALYAEMGQRLQEIASRQREAAFADPKNVALYLKEMRKRFGLQESDSGLCYGIVGNDGPRPAATDTVVISYSVAGFDGITKLPALSADHIHVKMKDLTPGLAEGLQMMTTDGHGMFIIPPAISYSKEKWPEGVERGPLFYRVDLHEIVSAEPAP